MSSIAMVLRVIFNVLLFVLYAAVAMVLVGFTKAAFTKYVLGYPVPGDGAISADIFAIITVLAVFVITLAWRKHFYLCLDKAQNKC